MTREEAIKWMEETIQDAEGLLDKCSPALKEEVLEQNEVFKIAISALRSAPQPGKPLTLDQLREMDGQPAYWPEDESWGIVSVDSAGKWAGKPFFKGRKQEVNFEYDIESRGMEVYAYPPAHIDRSKWEPCEFCNGKTVLYQYTNSTKLFVNTFGGAATLVTECNDCPPYADCCMKDISANSAFRIKFCPECGRPLTEAAWAELERRLRG